MNLKARLISACVVFAFVIVLAVVTSTGQTNSRIGSESAVAVHLRDGQEYDLSLPALVQFGEKVFAAKWTIEEGAGRPSAKGNANGSVLSDPSHALVFPLNFNRISGPDSNSCKGCHNDPFEGGGGDRATLVFVLAPRFDFASFDHNEAAPTKGSVDEAGQFVTLQTIGDERKTIGMNGSGFIEMLARQMTADLQAIRDSLKPGQRKTLISKGISFGVLSRDENHSWDTSGVVGLPAPSISTATADGKPSLQVLPFHQAGAVVSLRQFTNNAFFLPSVFTHMYPADLENYLREISRVLKKNATCFITMFLLNAESQKFVDAGSSTQNFTYPLEGCVTADPNNSEAALAFKETYVRSLFPASGLSIREPIHFCAWCGRREFLSYQDIVIAAKY